MKEQIRCEVDQAPPLSPERISRLRLIIHGPSGEPSLTPEMLAQKTTERLENTPQSAGHLYVLAFSSGTVKVGRTDSGRRRILQHRAEAARHGVELTDEWLSPAHTGWYQNERALIEHCESTGIRIGGNKSEYFTGLDFAAVRAFAESLVNIPK
ncbi:hypothetical protein AB0D67_17145 [Streptosporangium sp. NPDC048047]|uniref:hypothetical protein n=1 Tax=Streptosporangium sp. NPDC048047 TaxID=3155748 RepID=UPI00341BBA44